MVFVRDLKHTAHTLDADRHLISYDLLTYLLTYLLTPWCRVLLEKLIGMQLVKKFPAFHGTRKFITALTSVRFVSRGIIPHVSVS